MNPGILTSGYRPPPMPYGLLGLPSRGFDPRSIAGLGGWWDAMDSSTLTTGTGVSEWRDKSRFGQAFSQATRGSQPTLTASAISGRPGVTFSSGRFLNLGSQTIGGNNLVSAPGNPWSIYIVCRSTDNSALVKTLFGKGQNQVQLAQNTAGSLAQANGAAPSSSPVFPANVNGLFTFDYNGSFVQMRFNDGISTTATPTNTTNEAVNIALGMRNASSPFQHFVGHIGEVLFYNRSLNASERSSVVSYLSSKWGVAIPQYSPPTYADADANTYITRVEFADTLALETATRDAINDFIVGCKADGIWNSIKASCILCGARTLSGALTPLVDAAPTNNNFVGADYNRKTGLLGNGATKSLDTNRNNNVEPQNSFHLSVYASAVASSGYMIGDIYGTGWSGIARSGANLLFAARSISNATATAATGFLGVSRAASANFTSRISGTTTTTTQTSQTITQNRIRVFASNAGAGGTPGEWGAHRLAFYSIGESLTLSLLDSRVSTLYSAISTAIVPQVANADAQGWLNRVYDNGGTVSATTAAAVNDFCNAIDAAGIRDRFYRLNLFCGGNLAACRTPLYRATSLAGTQLGNTIDTNVGPFVDADYVEAGGSGGLKGNGSSKYLSTGLLVGDAMPSGTGNGHMSVYAASAQSAGSGNFRYHLGTPQLYLFARDGGPNAGLAWVSASAAIFTSVADITGHLVGTNSASNAREYFRNGTSIGSNSTIASPPAATSEFTVFGRSSQANVLFDGRLAAYSIGGPMTASQATAYYTAMQAFQTALGRNV